MEKSYCVKCKKDLPVENFKRQKNGNCYNRCRSCSGTCIHDKQRSRCKLCTESSTCGHKRFMKTCEKCIEQFKNYKLCVSCVTYMPIECFEEYKSCSKCRQRRKCEHGKFNLRCVICNPKESCSHKKIRKGCVHCMKKIEDKQYCKSCKRYQDPKEFGEYKQCSLCRLRQRERKCIHNKKTYSCDICTPQRLCLHSRVRRLCTICCVSMKICEHKKQKRQCRECDPLSHLRCIVAGRIYDALKAKKSKKTMEYVGCTVQKLKEHIEQKFKPDMTWKNYGSLWQIDHIIPIKFENPTLYDVIRRLHYTNLQPLYVLDNLQKGNRWIG